MTDDEQYCSHCHGEGGQYDSHQGQRHLKLVWVPCGHCNETGVVKVEELRCGCGVKVSEFDFDFVDGERVYRCLPCRLAPDYWKAVAQR